MVKHWNNLTDFSLLYVRKTGKGGNEGFLILYISYWKASVKKKEKVIEQNVYQCVLKLLFVLCYTCLLKPSAARMGLLCREPANWVILSKAVSDLLKGSLDNRWNTNRIEIGSCS